MNEAGEKSKNFLVTFVTYSFMQFHCPIIDRLWMTVNGSQTYPYRQNPMPVDNFMTYNIKQAPRRDILGPEVSVKKPQTKLITQCSECFLILSCVPDHILATKMFLFGSCCTLYQSTRPSTVTATHYASTRAQPEIFLRSFTVEHLWVTTNFQHAQKCTILVHILLQFIT